MSEEDYQRGRANGMREAYESLGFIGRTPVWVWGCMVLSWLGGFACGMGMR